PPGNLWLWRTGHGLTMAKKRNAAKTASVSGQVSRWKKYDGTGMAPCRARNSPIQTRKQSGTAMISSNTTEPVSVWIKIRSEEPQSQTDKKIPAPAPTTHHQTFPGSNRTTNQRSTTSEPKVPAANGIRPTPKHWSIQRMKLFFICFLIDRSRSAGGS